MTITTGQGCQSCSRSVSWTGKINYSLSPFAPENFWSRETGSAVPSRVSLLISILQAQSSVCLRDFSRVPLWRPFIIDTHYVLWMQQYIYVYILCTMILAALSSCSVSSTNECSRIKQKCQGRPGKYNPSQEFYIFCEQEHPQRHANTDRNPYCVYGTLKNTDGRKRGNCRPDVVTLGNPFDTMQRFCLYSQCSHLNL